MQAGTPIETLVLDGFNKTYFKSVQTWLAGLGCEFTKKEAGKYCITFPPGTVERAAAGKSTPWTYITEIVLPDQNETTITHVQSRQPSSDKTLHMIRVPKGIIQ